MAWLIVETDNCLILTRLQHIVDVDIVAEDLDRVGVGFVNRCAGEADKGGVGQGLA